MKTWQKAAIMTLITLAIGGIYLCTVFEHRRNPGIQPNTNPEQNLTRDDVGSRAHDVPDLLRRYRQTAGHQRVDEERLHHALLPLRKRPHRICQTRRRHPLRAASRYQKGHQGRGPADVDDGIDHGTRQVFVVFSLPGSPTLYATVVGAIDAGQEQYFSDVLFYYDDPHSIYDYWPKNVWAAIDAHQVIPGMSELQTQMSIGHNQQPRSPAKATAPSHTIRPARNGPSPSSITSNVH